MKSDEGYSPASIYDSITLASNKLNTLKLIEKLLLHLKFIELKISKIPEPLNSRAKKVEFFIENDICLTGIFRANEFLKYPGWAFGNDLIDQFFLGLETTARLNNNRIEPEVKPPTFPRNLIFSYQICLAWSLKMFNLPDLFPT